MEAVGDAARCLGRAMERSDSGYEGAFDSWGGFMRPPQRCFDALLLPHGWYCCGFCGGAVVYTLYSMEWVSLRECVANCIIYPNAT